MHELAPGLLYLPEYLDRAAQIAMVADIRAVVADAPLFTPKMPRNGKPFSVRMTNCGPLGWVSDRDGGYRYQATHPVTGQQWPTMPTSILRTWTELADYPHPPEACLVNFYGPEARMGLHQDRDEADFAHPVLSVSLGDTALFRIGGPRRTDPTGSLRLSSGDICVLAGEARRAFHGVDRILPGSSTLIPGSGRLNLTLRRAS